jgi:nucleotide-binding universal stress UspA family protein
MKLLIAYDGSECADAALDDLKRAGVPDRAEAVVLSVAEVWMPPPSAYAIAEEGMYMHHLAEVHRMEELAGRACERIRRDFPAWDVRPETTRGGPVWEILGKAGEWKPDLVVLGSHGHSALGRFFLGSVSSKVVSEAPCSVRVVRATRRDSDDPLRIVIGVKGAPSSDEAVRAVRARAWPKGTEVRLVTAFGPYSVFGSDLDEIMKGVARLHAEAGDALESAGLEVSSAIAEGDPKRMLVELAEAWGADCLFVGTRDLNRTGRVLLGSVSSAVVHRVHCSVEVVRA